MTYSLLNKLKVVIVDDNPTDIFTLKKVLEDSGWIKISNTFTNGADFLKAFSESDFQADVVVLDYRMPILDGLETYRNLMNRKLPFKVLMTSHAYYSAIMRELMNAGCQNYCRKKPEIILNAIPKLIEGRNIYEDLSPIHLWEGISRKDELKNMDNSYWQELLNPVDKKIIYFVCCGLNSSEIAVLLGYETSSIEKYRGQILHNLGLLNSQQLSSWAVSNGIITASQIIEELHKVEIIELKSRRIKTKKNRPKK